MQTPTPKTAPNLYSFIVPVYNRPEELTELLESLVQQTRKGFEVVVVDDGSQQRSEAVCKKYEKLLEVQYFFIENSGQGFARNFGFAKAKGDYFIVLDSDVIVPPVYLEKVHDFLSKDYVDAYGGPDAALPSFTEVQQAINYSMTSFITTGGIRGKKQHLGAYHPRSFNMGVSREVWAKTGGYRITRLGEDIEWSIRIIRSGFRTALIEEAFVYHKRRTDFHRFYKQLQFFGKARINIYHFYPDELKLVHFFPALFTVYLFTSLCFALSATLLIDWRLGALFLLPFLFFAGIIFVDATAKTNSLRIGALSVRAAFTQLIGYGTGFLQAAWRRIILRKDNNISDYPS
ncbi:MAG: glycosyltransferase [Chitinophagales bacterium]|nr:glycosyltransferase [Bacteroidota bacterium]MCB9043934.1 glycosyltransferase [Chitinophagales bacterium]